MAAESARSSADSAASPPGGPAAGGTARPREAASGPWFTVVAMTAEALSRGLPSAVASLPVYRHLRRFEFSRRCRRSARWTWAAAAARQASEPGEEAVAVL